ncbi:MAG: hypothetical protein ACE5FK_03285 [Candidatus Methylomirabilia bacterium]
MKSGGRLHGARIPFSREVASAAETRAVLIEMLHDARQRLSL